MIRLYIVLLATFGCFVGLSLLSVHFHSIAHTAFNIGSFGVTWILLGTCLTGYAALKVSK
jgi:hypothetical protein